MGFPNGGIKLSTNFEINAGIPIDARYVVADISERDLIDFRYSGMMVWVQSEQIHYKLLNDLSTWELFDGGGSNINVTNGLSELSSGTIGLGGNITQDSNIDLDNDLIFNIKDRAIDRKFTFLSSNYGTNSNVSVFSIRNDGNSNLSSNTADIIIGGGNTNNTITSKGRNIFGNNNAKNISADNGNLTIVGNNNLNSYSGESGHSTVVGVDNSNNVDSEYDTIVGTGNFANLVDSTGDNVAIGTWNANATSSMGAYNTFLGDYNAFGVTDSIGDGNILVGGCVYFASTIGDRNVMLGVNVGSNSPNITDNNVFIGANAGRDITGNFINDGNHDFNTLIGSFAGANIDGDNFNETTAIGISSLRYGGGDENIAVGRASGWQMKGSRNSSLGSRSGQPSDVNYTNDSGSEFTGDRCTFIGVGSGYESSTGNVTDMNVIGSYYGNESKATFIASLGNTYLISNTDTSEVKLRLPQEYASSGQVLTDGNGDGNLSWSSVTYQYGQTLFVDATNGNDSSAIKGDFNKPYKTLSGAVSQASSGDNIVVYAGQYTNEINLALNGVDWHFNIGAEINNTIDGSIFQEQSSINYNVTGHLVATINSPTTNAYIMVARANQNVNFEFLRLENYKQACIRTKLGHGIVNIKGDTIIGHGNQAVGLGGYDSNELSTYDVRTTQLIQDAEGSTAGWNGTIYIAQNLQSKITGEFISNIENVPAIFENDVFIGNYLIEYHNCSFINSAGTNGVCMTINGLNKSQILFTGSNRFYCTDTSGISIKYEHTGISVKFLALGEIISNVSEGGASIGNVDRIGGGSITVDNRYIVVGL